MKKTNQVICLLIFLFGFVATLKAENTQDPIAKLVNPAIQSLMQKNNIPGMAVELYVAGKPYAYYFGYADLEKKKLVNANTIFELGSVTKVMTSIVLAEEIDQAIVQLEDPLKKYFPDLPSTYDRITLKNLATYTAGFPLNLPGTIKTPSEVNHYLKQFPIEKNKEWQYSNVSIGLLGEVLKKVMRKDIEDIYRVRLLGPLKMQAVGFTLPKKYLNHYAQGYDEKGQKATPVKSDLLETAYSLKASALDMQRFLSAAIGLPQTPPRIFYPVKMTQVAYLKLPNYRQGLAWKLYSLKDNKYEKLLSDTTDDDLGPLPIQEIYERPNYNGDDLMEKTGMTKGFKAYIAVIPNKKSGIVLLANKNIPNKDFVKIGREILLTLTNQKT